MALGSGVVTCVIYSCMALGSVVVTFVIYSCLALDTEVFTRVIVTNYILFHERVGRFGPFCIRGVWPLLYLWCVAMALASFWFASCS